MEGLVTWDICSLPIGRLTIASHDSIVNRQYLVTTTTGNSFLAKYKITKHEIKSLNQLSIKNDWTQGTLDMSWPNIRAIKKFFVQQIQKKLTKMNNIRRRRESVASVYRRTTKFLSANTPNLLKKMAPNKKNQLLAKIIEEQERNHIIRNKTKRSICSEEDDDLGERELEYYLGVRKKEFCWRDKEGQEKIRKDYLLYHCRISEEEYNAHFKKSIPRPTYNVQPRIKQVPLKIHKKKPKKQNGKEESWCERSKIFKLFTNKKDSESTSSSYSIESIEEIVRSVESTENVEDDAKKLTDDIELMTVNLNNVYLCDNVDALLQEVRIFRKSTNTCCKT